MNGRRIAGVAIAIAMLLVALHRERSDGSSSASVAREHVRDTSSEPLRLGHDVREASDEAELDASSELRDLRDARLIENVELEPAEPCVGEDALVHVRLRDSARHAKVVVDGRPGAPGVLRADASGPQEVRVLVRSWDDRFERRVVRWHARGCEQARLGARVSSRVVGDRRYVLRLEPAPRGEVVWELGDGVRAEGPTVEHRYAARSDRTHSSYVVSARYEGPGGPEIARATLTHVEPEGIAARSNAPALRDEGERFVSWSPRAGLRSTRHLTNPLDEALDLELAEVRGFPCDGSEAQTRQLPANEVFDETHLAPGASVDVGMRLQPDLFSKPVCQVLVRAGGRVGARIATTTIALDTGLPDERHPIDDEATLRAIVALAEEGDGPISGEAIAAYLAR